ncbi:MAG: GntR family transcriptional regulator [Anaerolineales bacterium]|jgi:DNA-binding GntR family transcriptional regulator
MFLEGELLTHQQLNVRVSAWLRAAILNGQIKPGEWIRQKRIADALGVSQMPVREALKELVAWGLVEHIPYRGARVIQLSLDDISDLFAQRANLEGRAARASAGALTSEEMDRLYGLQTEMEASLFPENVNQYRGCNREFHQIIYRASKRDYLIRTLDQIWVTFPTMLFGSFPQTANRLVPRTEIPDIQEHHAILDALAACKPALAERVMRDHIRHAGRELVSFLKELGV